MVAPVSSFTFNSSLSLYTINEKTNFNHTYYNYIIQNIYITKENKREEQVVYLALHICFIKEKIKRKEEIEGEEEDLPDHGPLAHFPSDIAALSSLYDVTSTMLLPNINFTSVSLISVKFQARLIPYHTI